MRKHRPELEDITNSQISGLIDEWIHGERDRLILKYKLIDGLTYGQICDRLYADHDIILSERQLQNIVYKAENILFKHI